MLLFKEYHNYKPQSKFKKKWRFPTEMIKSKDTLPKPKVKASQFPVHLSYLLQNCKKGKPPEKGLSWLKNDITGSEPTVKMLDT